EQLGELPRRREIPKAVAFPAAIEQSKGGELLEDLGGQAAERRQLTRGISLGLLAGVHPPRPFEELPLARDRGSIGSREAETPRRPAVGKQRPSELADYEHAGLSGQAAPRRAPLPAHQREGLLPLHRSEPPSEGDDAL